jgi:16S rRNA (cytosine967-C5)-methyltransferase
VRTGGGKLPSGVQLSAGRDRVMAAISTHAVDFPDLSPSMLNEKGLSGRDAALMHAMYDAAIRRWTTLEWLLSVAAGRDVRELEPAVRAGLLVGAAQLLILDRIPDHAAIDESVEWLKHIKGKGAAGLANAVLRKVGRLRQMNEAGERVYRSAWTGRLDEIPLEDGRALALTASVLPDEWAVRAAVATGVSSWLIRRWEKQHGADAARRIALHGVGGTPVIVNATCAERPVDFPLAAGGALTLRKHTAAGHFVVEGPREGLVSFLESRRDVWVQDPSSSAAVESIRDLRPGVVVDLCAGQGTKTRQLAAVFAHAKVFATDVDERRFVMLREQFVGHDRVSVVPPDQIAAEIARAGGADLILLDVPCSNTGVLARRVEARHRAGDEQLARLSEIQAGIVESAARMLKAGGAILYATCSIENEENGAIVRRAVSKFGCVLSHERSDQPTGGPGSAATEHRDGSYSALLTFTGS